MKSTVSALALAICLAGCSTASANEDVATVDSAAQSLEERADQIAAEADRASAPTLEEARAFVARAEKELAEFVVISSKAQWVNATYITDDTDALAAHFGTIGTEMSVRFANEAAKYAGVPGLDYDTKRKLDILRGALVLPAPTTEGAAAELNTIATRLSSTYGKGRGTLDGKPMTGNDLEEKMGTVRNPAQLKEMWTSWHTNVGRPMRPDYVRLTEIANEGAKALGYPDTGAMWRSRYDMSPDEFAAMTDRLWSEVKPLYDELHCYTRAKLNDKYGDQVQPETGPIRA
ncbi:MAG: M2 family metallopeptidase, partial [Allosphingosinicella sp.]